MKRAALWLLVGLLVAVVTVVWVVPVVAGPEVDCGSYDTATCAEVWPEVAEELGPEVPLPVTRVVIHGDWRTGCGEFLVYRWIFGWYQEGLC